MQHPAIADPQTALSDTPGLHLFRPKTPALALGLAVSHLMTKPAFAHLKFGDWSRVLAGQINRGHYYFVVDGRNGIVGFVGWAETTRERAEAWVEGQAGVSDEHARGGNCVLLNGWAANTPEVNRFLVDAARVFWRDKETIYFKRHYKSGGTRASRLSVNAFVHRHIARRAREAAAEPAL